MLSSPHHHNGQPQSHQHQQQQKACTIAMPHVYNNNSMTKTAIPASMFVNRRNYSYVEAIKDGEERLKLIDVIDNMRSPPLPPKSSNYVKSLTICNSALSGSHANTKQQSNGLLQKITKHTTTTTKTKAPGSPQPPKTISTTLPNTIDPPSTLFKSQSQSSILNLFKAHFTSPFLNRKCRSKSKENHKHANPPKVANKKSSKAEPHVDQAGNKPKIISRKSAQATTVKTSLTIKLTDEQQVPSVSPSKSTVSSSSIGSLLKTNEQSNNTTILNAMSKSPSQPCTSTTTTVKIANSPSCDTHMLKIDDIERQTSLSKTSSNTTCSSPNAFHSPRQQSSLRLACMINGYDILTTHCLLQTRRKLDELKIKDSECTTTSTATTTATTTTACNGHNSDNDKSSVKSPVNYQQPKVVVKVCVVIYFTDTHTCTGKINLGTIKIGTSQM
jgi:hypothetical protein